MPHACPTRRVADLLAPQLRVGHPPAIIDHRQGQWDHSLVRIGTERLHSPARQGEIAVIADPLRRNGRTEPVVATDVIATQESAVRGGADRSADAPIGVELKLAARVYMAADILFRGPRTAAGGDARTICDKIGRHTSELQSLMRNSY